MPPSSSVAQPAPAKLKTRSEFSVTLEVAPSSGDSASFFRYEFKEAGSTWEQGAQHVDAAVGADEVVLDDLNPTSTYEVRIYEVATGADGNEQVSAPSEVAAVDTEVPGCGPDSGQGCLCTIQ
ncbi:Immunoglobulin-like fold [Phytophthora cinnamomi]|uniref:Immunoglobulin-like fold n=1 Tax=Phytophthora cinnamomi TaxID=4785 RepID=UPI003559B105|nr:Immunoglobulin-like fold [Phytophthora cinnamomi]